MRKGRSQRKTRGSLPPTSKRAQSRLDVSAPSASGGGSGGPQVVVGLTAPRSEEPLEALETRETRAQTRENERERLQLVREKSLEIVRESLELVRESLELEPEPTHETLTFDPPAAFHDAPDDEAVNVQATAPVKTQPRQMTLPTPDEMSIPPMGDLAVEVEPIADRFFSEGELVAARGLDSQNEDWDERAHKSVRKSLPEVVQRRARFAKYVRWAVGGAAVVCLAALARTALPPTAPAGSSLSSLSNDAPAVKAAGAAVVAAEPTKPADDVTAPVVAVPAQAAQAAQAAPVAEAAQAAPVAEPTAAPAAESPAAPAVATSDKTALQEKKDSQRALERGKLADAIAAGERSVALDPTDGEAWLLLGAAYQEKGNNADARRCYSSCIKEGKRGPLGECRAMIR